MDKKNIELNEKNREYLDYLRSVLAEHKITWTDASVDFVLNGLNKSFEDTTQYSDENLKTILICGLPDHSRSEALQVISKLRKYGMTYREMHALLVYILKRDHFFMDTMGAVNFANTLEVLARM